MDTKLVGSILGSIFIIFVIGLNLNGYYNGTYTDAEKEEIKENVFYSKIPEIKHDDNSLDKLYNAYDLKGEYLKSLNN